MNEPAAAPPAEPESRRDFMGRIYPALGWGCLGAFGLASCAATLRFFFPRVLSEPPTAFRVGSPDDYSVGEVSERFFKQHRVWMVRDRLGIFAVQAQCTHLGCTPTWYSEEALFKCPCHGSNFNLEGDVIAGPAPEPLRRLALRLDENGQIIVDRAISENRQRLRESGTFRLRL